MKGSNEHIGKVFTLKNNITATVINYKGARNVDVILSNGCIIKSITIGNLKNRQVSNPLEITAYGVGIFGQPDTNLKHFKKAYLTWRGIMGRCYDDNIQKKQPTYIGCKTDDEWHFFPNFLDWYSKKYIEGYELDKDILIKGNKIYSPKTCCFVPKEINTLLTNSKTTRNGLIGTYKLTNGKYSTQITIDSKTKSLGRFNTELEAFEKYKQEKEGHIKDLALLYYSNGIISEECYNALICYEININD